MAKKKILVADDEMGVRESLKLLLKYYSYDVDFANDGVEALKLAEKTEYDIFFLDCNMPELTGVELTKKILEKRPNSIIVITTGYDTMDKDFSLMIGAHEYIRKPFTQKEIDKIVKKYLAN